MTTAAELAAIKAKAMTEIGLAKMLKQAWAKTRCPRTKLEHSEARSLGFLFQEEYEAALECGSGI